MPAKLVGTVIGAARSGASDVALGDEIFGVLGEEVVTTSESSTTKYMQSSMSAHFAIDQAKDADPSTLLKLVPRTCRHQRTAPSPTDVREHGFIRAMSKSTAPSEPCRRARLHPSHL